MERITAAALVAVATATPAFADRHANDSPWSASLGIASISALAWLGDDEHRTAVVPSLELDYRERVFVSTAEGIGANVVHRGGWRAGPVLAYHPGRREDESEPFFVDDKKSGDLAGLGDVDATAELGGFVEYTAGALVSSVELRQGLGGHEGLIGEVSLQWRGGVSAGGAPFSFAVGPTAVLGDADYVNAFFGVDIAQSATSGLAVHDADGGLVSYGLHGSFVVPLTPRVSLIGFGAYDVLGEELGDSPLVSARGSDEQAVLGASLTISF